MSPSFDGRHALQHGRGGERLDAQGVHARVLSMHTLKPLDIEAVRSAAADTGRIVTIEEHSIVGGLGSAVAEVLAETDDVHPRFKRLGVTPHFAARVGTQEYLLSEHGLTAEQIANSVKKFVSVPPPRRHELESRQSSMSCRTEASFVAAQRGDEEDRGVKTAPNSVLPQDAAGVVSSDIDYCLSHLTNEFTAMAGRQVLLTGGAGFLGYYLVQTLLAWNRTVRPDRSHRADGHRQFHSRTAAMARGAARRAASRDPARHDSASPAGVRCVRLLHSRGVNRLADLLPPASDRHHGRQCERSATAARPCPQQQQAPGVRSVVLFEQRDLWRPRATARSRLRKRIRGGFPRPVLVPVTTNRSDTARRLCVNFARQYGLPITMARPFNNYGPGLKITDRRVIPDLARDLLAGRDLVLLSDGSPTRTFCYVADAIVGYYRILLRGRPGEAYNIGDESPEITMGELASDVADSWTPVVRLLGQCRAAGKRGFPLPDRQPATPLPGYLEGQRELGFSPEVDVEEGLRRTLLWYSENREAQEA